MRTPEQKQEIIDSFGEPFAVDDFMTQYEVDYLIQLFEDGRDKIHKNTGPVTMDITPEMRKLPIFQNIFTRLWDHIGDYEFLSGFFFYVEAPHIIHNDDSWEFPTTYKGITLPLRFTGANEYPYLCFFDQYYLDGPSKFFNGGSNLNIYYNQPVYEYSQVQGTTDLPFDEETRLKYLTHLRPKWLEGLSFDRALKQIPGRALIFDAVRLHSANNFVKQGITSKLGISIFTKRK